MLCINRATWVPTVVTAATQMTGSRPTSMPYSTRAAPSSFLAKRASTVRMEKSLFWRVGSRLSPLPIQADQCLRDSAERCGDAVQQPGDLGANGRNSSNTDDGDQADEHAVFDESRALL